MHARHVSALSATILLAGLLATGCTSTDDSPSPPQTAPGPVGSSSAPPPSSAAPSETATSPAPADTPLVDRLLPTGQVPGLNATWTWQDGDTGMPSADPFGVCAKADLLSIGASEVFARSY